MEVAEEGEHVGSVLHRLLPRNVLIVVELAKGGVVIEERLHQVELRQGTVPLHLKHACSQQLDFADREVFDLIEGPTELRRLLLHQAVLKVWLEEANMAIPGCTELRLRRIVSGDCHVPSPRRILLVSLRRKQLAWPEVSPVGEHTLGVDQRMQNAELTLETSVHLVFIQQDPSVGPDLDADPLSRHLSLPLEGHKLRHFTSPVWARLFAGD
mmetsp:Transcript_51155/g.159809  ORF Transcript_51155/g.159809 Transcript_51155/m.159809 type:complete len:212 (-) Transcript_51155:1216-1851(-)